MKKLLYLAFFISLTSCELQTQKGDAVSAREIEGLYVFILSKPKLEVESLGYISNNVTEQLDEATEGKKRVGKIIEGIFSTTVKNTSFKHLVTHMVRMAKEQYPEAEAVVFDTSLSRAEVVKFRKISTGL